MVASSLWLDPTRNEVRPGPENYSGFKRRFQQNKDKKDKNRSKKKSSKRLREPNSQGKPAEPVEDVSPTPATHAPLLRSTSTGIRGEIIVRALEIIGDGWGDKGRSFNSPNSL